MMFEKNIGIANMHVDTILSIANCDINLGDTFHVKIDHFDDPNIITSSCSCENSSCSHQVVLHLLLVEFLSGLDKEEVLKLIQNDGVITDEDLSSTQDSEPYLLTYIFPLSKSAIERHITPEVDYDLKKRNFQIENYGVTPDKILKMDIAMYSRIWADRIEATNTVEIFYKDDDFYAKCTCEYEGEKICAHQAKALQYNLERFGDNFLIQLKPRYTSEKLDRKIYDNTLNDNIHFHRNRNSEELNFSDSDRIENLKSAFTKITDLAILQPISNTDEYFTLGFLFDFSKARGQYPLNDIIILKGKQTNTPFLKYIARYYDSDANATTKTDEEANLILKIKSISDDLNTIAYFSEEDINKTKTIFGHLQEIFRLLKDKKYVYKRISSTNSLWDTSLKKKDLVPANVSTTPAILFFELKEEEDCFVLRAKLNLGDQDIEIPTNQIEANKLLSSKLLVNDEETLYLHESLNQAQVIDSTFAKQPRFVVDKANFDQLFDEIIQPLSENYNIEMGEMESIERQKVELSPLRKQVYISELGDFVIFKPVVVYDHDKMTNICDAVTLFDRDENKIVEYIRDTEYEIAFNQLFSGLHDEFEDQDNYDFYYLPHQALLKRNWFFDFYEKMSEIGIELFGINDLKKIKYSPHKANITAHISSGQDWFDLQLEVKFGDELVSLAKLRKAIVNKNKFVQLADGKLGILPEEWVDKLEKYFRVGEVDEESIKISKMKFSIIDELFEDIDNENVLAELLEKKNMLKGFESIEQLEIPKKITASLRDYQKEGFNWLNFLKKFKWGGILADDMGLGKTLQVLTMLQNQKDTDGVNPSLIIIPTSLLFNWENEIKKFAPNLTFTIHHGLNRITNFESFNNFDLIITTYGIVARDIEKLSKLTFKYIVLDESQAIKNPSSQRYKAVCVLKGEHKIAMTGTPIENNTFDLYAQLNFLNPGFLGSQSYFKNEYSKPIDANRDVERSKELQNLIKPFVLRRTKEQVAKDLPEKIEDYIYLTMEDEQQKVYNAFRDKYRNYLMGKIEENGLQRSKMYVLEGLMKLRQICDSPALLPDKEDYGNESVKIKELLNHVTEKTGNHKILIFSQFVKMLKLIIPEFEKAGIQYEYLDGQRSKKQREASVNNFQNNEDIRVFLISLKAGNTGLNLTAADYVYIVDPWWNPAVENQAIDRTHRIGQTKSVIAYRMIVKGTVEEKIVNYQKRKKKIASDIIQTEESFLKSVSRDDILDLFG